LQAEVRRWHARSPALTSLRLRLTRPFKSPRPPVAFEPCAATTMPWPTGPPSASTSWCIRSSHSLSAPLRARGLIFPLGDRYHYRSLRLDRGRGLATGGTGLIITFVPHGCAGWGLRRLSPAGLEVGSRGVAY
jgi:hypothetical protein